jgi:hypothetical protein
MNFREKIVQENMELINAHPTRLTDWEREFMQTLNGYAVPSECSPAQFNRLKDIADRIREEV